MLLEQKSDYYPHINLLRGIAALMVCIYHFSHYTGFQGYLFPQDSYMQIVGEYGRMGVYVFFVISGFVIPLSMFKGGYRYPSFGRFLLKRSIRIEPPYIAAILLIIAVGIWMGHRWGSGYYISKTQLVLHAGYLIPFTHLGFFTAHPYEWYNPIFWTLAIEFQYYLAMALLFPLLVSKHKILQHATLAVFLGAQYFFTSIDFLPEHTAVFVPGIVLFMYRAKLFNAGEMLAWLGAALTTICIDRIDTPYVIAATVLLTFIAMWLLRSNTRLGNRFGDISYSLYLTHGSTGSIFLLFRSSAQFSASMRYGAFFAALGISVAFAYAFWWMIERPTRKWSQMVKLKK